MFSNHRSISAFICLIAFVFVAAAATEAQVLSETPTAPSEMKATLAAGPLVFVQNVGQWPDSILFRADAGMAAMWFTRTGAYYQFTRGIDGDPADRALETDMIRAVFTGAGPSPRLHGEVVCDGQYHFLIGDDPDGWYRNVPAYRALVFEDLYPGIDLRYYGRGGQMEYDFIAEPGADLTQVQVRYEGARSLEVNPAGELVVHATWASVTEHVPFAYQVGGEDIVPVSAAYVLIDHQTFGFTVLDPVRADLALVIDPLLTYCSYLGGSGDDRAHGIDMDDLGNAYVAGQTASTNFPTQDPYQGHQGATDAFVMKMSPDGQSLLFGTYVGGTSHDYAYDVAVGSKGGVYITGVTESTDFPTVNPLHGDQGSYDGFVAKLSASGDSLIYSTYLGGSSTDEPWSVDVDGNGYAYVTGSTGSSNFPTKNPYLTKQAGEDAFVVKLAQTGDSLVYGTFVGGDHIDIAYGLALDGDENVYITGQTRSSDFPTFNQYQSDQGDVDAFVAKLNADGDSLIYGTYLGGSALDVGWGVTVDGSGQAHITGVTSSTDFPTVNAYQSDQGLDDAFLVKLNAAGDSPVYATYLGGAAADYGRGVGVDADGRAFVVGWTLSSDFPTVNPHQTSRDTVDGFAVIFDAAGSALEYGTYLAGSGVDDARAIAVVADGDACVVGRTDSPNFLTQDPYQTDQGGRDGFVLMLERIAVAVSDDDPVGPPERFDWVDNYPNPFNVNTVIRFALARPEHVEITVYNVLGERVATLCDRVLSAGPQEMRWDGLDASGAELPTGTYLYRLRTGERLLEGKMMLLK